MKKVIVALLLVMPLVLVYFISFTGQIFSKYKHIDVERIVVLNDLNQEYEDGDYIKMEPNQTFELKIKIFPELATNKKVTITNSDKSVCTVDENYTLKTLKNGISKLIISSVDRHFVQFLINIQVTQDNILDFVLSKEEVQVNVNKSFRVDAQILPDTTLLENRELIWTSLDESIAKVSQFGVITGLSLGETKIKVHSKQNPKLEKFVKVLVTSEYATGVFFSDSQGDGKIYTVSNSIFDLYSIVIVNINDVTLNDIKDDINFSVGAITSVSGAIEVSRLSEGIIIFNKEKEMVKIILNVDVNGVNYEDNITLWYVA